MGRYLHTQGISAGIVDLIKRAKQRLYIISPYLKLSDTLRDLLRDKNAEAVETHIVFGKQELAPDELKFLRALKHVRLFFYKNLHAKCYLNEHEMIIASMNLYEFSQQTNREMGVLVDRQADAEVYGEAWEDIQSIKRNSEAFSFAPVANGSKQRTSTRRSSRGQEHRTSVSDDDGAFCMGVVQI